MHHHPPITDRPSTAGDVMSPSIVSVAPGTSVKEVAALLLEHRISAVPVVDDAGSLVGMVSEGDLLGRSNEDWLRGQEWWLAVLSEPGQRDAAVTEADVVRPVRDVMHAPVITIGQDAPLHEVAEMLRVHGIKRLPVMHGGRMVGIVSRADLLRVVEGIPEIPGVVHSTGGLAGMIMSFFGKALHGKAASGDKSAPPGSAPDVPAPATADMFRHLAEASHLGMVDERKATAHAAELERLRQVKAMLQEHVGAEMWETLLTHARVAAAHGEKEIQLLRFPSGLCSDEGRKINNADPEWPETLRGEAGEVYARWERELRPAGFGLAARVITYPEGRPGDVGLFLVWER